MATTIETVTPRAAPTATPEKRQKGPQRLFTPELMGPALRDSVRKLNPRTLVLNPVMFVVEVGSLLTTIMLVKLITDGASVKAILVNGLIIIFLWLTVVFANFAEALAEGRGDRKSGV